MASEDWIPDTVVGFLHSPVWTVPIMTFIEEKCIVFDPSEENKLEYTEIHNKYKELVEYLLESFIEDLQIDAASFVEACKNAQDPSTSEATLLLFEQVMAAQSFPVFKTMMVQRNIELELQALRLIQRCNGVIPAALRPDQDTSGDFHQAMIFDDDEEIMRKIMKQSEDEYKQQQASKTGAIDSTLENVLATSKVEAERLEKEKKKEEDIMKKVIEESKEQELLRQRTFEHMDSVTLEKVLQMSLDDDEMKAAKAAAAAASQSSLQGLPKISSSEQKKSSSDSKKKKSPSSKSPPAPSKDTSSQKVAAPSTSSKTPPPTGKAPSSSKSGSDAAASWLDSARAEAAAASSTKSESTSSTPASDAAELKKREEYLKQQRDRLMAMKKKEREKSLNDFSKKEASKSRPKSAMAAKNATSGKVTVESGDQAADDKKMKMRMALAERLKKEVIQK